MGGYRGEFEGEGRVETVLNCHTSQSTYTMLHYIDEAHSANRRSLIDVRARI